MSADVSLISLTSADLTKVHQILFKHQLFFPQVKIQFQDSILIQISAFSASFLFLINSRFSCGKGCFFASFKETEMEKKNLVSLLETSKDTFISHQFFELRNRKKSFSSSTSGGAARKIRLIEFQNFSTFSLF